MSTARWTDEYLEQMRQVTDPPADETVRAIFSSGTGEEVNALLQHLIANDQVVPDELPVEVRRFLEVSAPLPRWADPAKIRRGQEFFGVHGISIVMALFCASLPATYAAAKGVRVLDLTARMRTDVRRRVTETAQMLVNVMAPGGLELGGYGIRDAQRVRLMHAAVRYWALKSGKWDPSWGQPINQEDLAGTLLSFTVTVFQALDRLGLRTHSRDQEAYLHTWNVVGHILGVHSDLMAHSLADAETLRAIIERRQFRPSEAGHAMARGLVALLEHITPGTVFDGLPQSLIRYFDERVADILGIGAADWTLKLAGPARRLIGRVLGEQEAGELMARVGERYSRHLVDGLLWVELGGKRALFTLPQGLRDRWRIGP